MKQRLCGVSCFVNCLDIDGMRRLSVNVAGIYIGRGLKNLLNGFSESEGLNSNDINSIPRDEIYLDLLEQQPEDETMDQKAFDE